MLAHSALLTSPPIIPSRHEPPTVHFCSPFISHPLPSAQPSFPPSSRAVSPSSTAFTPNRPLTPLSTAFTQTHPSVGASAPSQRSLRLCVIICRRFLRPLLSYRYELLFPQTLCSHNHPHCLRVSPFKAFSSLRSLCLRPLFSIACALFDKNTRGMGTPDAAATPSGLYGFARANFSWKIFAALALDRSIQVPQVTLTALSNLEGTSGRDFVARSAAASEN
jgi:hypothetical protein